MDVCESITDNLVDEMKLDQEHVLEALGPDIKRFIDIVILKLEREF